MTSCGSGGAFFAPGFAEGEDAGGVTVDAGVAGGVGVAGGAGSEEGGVEDGGVGSIATEPYCGAGTSTSTGGESG